MFRVNKFRAIGIGSALLLLLLVLRWLRVGARPWRLGDQQVNTRTVSPKGRGRQRLCICANAVLFGGKDVLKASAGTKLRIDGELSEVLCELAKSSELFLITQTDDDEVERLVVDALETSGVFAAGMNRLVG